MKKNLIQFAFALTAAGALLADVKPTEAARASQSPFACNLKAFNPEERKRWRALIDEVIPAATEVRELRDGYTLHLNASRVSVMKLAEWIELERKCCPFFDFEVDVRGEDGTLWLRLKGREGVKQFIQQDFTRLRLSESSGGK